jgi:hypothetical protein
MQLFIEDLKPIIIYNLFINIYKNELERDVQKIWGDMCALLSTCGKYELWWCPPFEWLVPIKKFVVRHVGGIPWWDIATRPALNLCDDKWGLDVTTGLGVIHLGIDVGIGDWGMVCALGLLIFPVI